MTPDRWQQIKAVLEDAWQHDPAGRAEFLDQACTRDPELRLEIEALLASDENIGEFLEHTAGEPAAFQPAGPSDEDPLAGRRIGPYSIVCEIGRGGMGTVYLAERADGQFRKRVAIKVVDPHLGSSEVLRRFRNERQVLAALDHPHIAKLLDGGATEDGLPYLVMEYVEGVHIDTWCNGRKLPLRDRLELFRKVCDAVKYAHEQQVIHRDIKPANILVTADGTPELLDFGIAKVLNPGLSAETMETTVGRGPMTPEYASPEQIRGERVGPASDVYSLGMLLYNLLTGKLPYSVQGQDLAQIGRLICEGEPMKPSESAPVLRHELAGDLDTIVLKALRKEPERRFSTVAQLTDDLGRFLQDLPVHARGETLPYRARKFLKRNRAASSTAVITAALILAVVAGLGRLGTPRTAMDTAVPSIAVLPLQNLSGDSEQEYFADGITDALIGELARIRGLRVISRTSVMSYKGAHRPTPEIARRLGVQTIAEGSVLRAGNRVRIAMHLIDAPKDRTVWSASYEGELGDVLALQSQVAGAIAGAIHVNLTAPDRTRTSRGRRVNLAAYDAYLKGRHQFASEFSNESIQKAIAWFQKALAVDPNYAPAYAGIADCYYMVSSQYYPPAEVMPKAKWAAQKALALDETLGEAQATLALVQSLYEFDHAGAEKGFKRALELMPGGAEAHLWYGLHLAAMSRFDEAIAQVEQAQRLDPISPGTNAYIGAPLYFARRYDDAIQRLQSIAGLSPDNQQAHAFLALCYEQKRNWTKAIEEMERAYALDPEPEALAQLGHMYAMSGRLADARKALKRLQDVSLRRYVSAYDMALLYAGLGERDETFRWLEKVNEDRSEWFAMVNVDPRLDRLHSDPRFDGVLRSVGLAK